ncbi:MAG: hypothetical protein NVV74_03855 [Magnetospirillum sp.]|nr:hypothetical protein [Magnetospirillum sp.]
MVPGLSLLIVIAIVAVALWAIALRWQHDFPRGPVPVLRRPYDNQNHTLTLVGKDGRPNPAQYEVFPNYASALVRQRGLSRTGQASVITHTDSGEVRMDFATMFGPFGRIYY